jgi:hypothetical protein
MTKKEIDAILAEIQSLANQVEQQIKGKKD